MADIGLDKAGELIKSFRPTEEHQQGIAQIFFGSLLSRTIVALGMLLVYLVVLGLTLFQFRNFHSEISKACGTYWLVVVLATPLVFILLFHILPAVWRAQRERRLKASVIGGEPQFRPGYFRLYPYDKTDREAFKRLDGADLDILNWLTSTQASLLYLSGASGVGKSSLLAADVLPKLRDRGWAVVETRLFGDPVERLRMALRADKELFPRKPAADLPSPTSSGKRPRAARRRMPRRSSSSSISSRSS